MAGVLERIIGPRKPPRTKGYSLKLHGFLSISEEEAKKLLEEAANQ
jgi:hypothetical protein